MASLTKGQTTESLEQFHVYDDFKSDDYERKLKVCEVCSCNSHVFFLSGYDLTPTWLRENTAIFKANARKVGSYTLQLSNFFRSKSKDI